MKYPGIPYVKGQKVTYSDVAPTTAKFGDLWFDTKSSNVYIAFAKERSLEWKLRAKNYRTYEQGLIEKYGSSKFCPSIAELIDGQDEKFFYVPENVSNLTLMYADYQYSRSFGPVLDMKTYRSVKRYRKSNVSSEYNLVDLLADMDSERYLSVYSIIGNIVGKVFDKPKKFYKNNNGGFDIEILDDSLTYQNAVDACRNWEGDYSHGKLGSHSSMIKIWDGVFKAIGYCWGFVVANYKEKIITDNNGSTKVRIGDILKTWGVEVFIIDDKDTGHVRYHCYLGEKR